MDCLRDICLEIERFQQPPESPVYSLRVRDIRLEVEGEQVVSELLIGREMPVVRSCGPIRLCLLRENDEEDDDSIGASVIVRLRLCTIEKLSFATQNCSSGHF